MARSAASFARPKARFKPQPLVLVLCEDSKSSVLYLKDAARHFRSQARVEVAHCGKTDPKGIVEEAGQLQHKFDTVYCVIDRDRHETFDEAVALAALNPKKIQVIASYPCYEFWLLLHFGKTRKPYREAGNLSAGDLLVKDLREQNGMKKYAKGSPSGLFEDLLNRLPDARKWAKEVLKEAIEQEEPNPSTKLHELIDRFESLGTPQPIDES